MITSKPMVSVFIEAVPVNLLIAKAVCEDNRDNHADYTPFGMLIRIRGDKKLVLKRVVIEEAIGRELTENEWQSAAWNYIGTISKSEQNELIFEDSAESKIMDAYWDKRLESYKKKNSFY
ncbi:MAG: MmoB/DmpM family protein [Methanophagales archaeon]|nr:MmoB/DmpM family protein [Methanophagales archaeon]